MPPIAVDPVPVPVAGAVEGAGFLDEQVFALRHQKVGVRMPLVVVSRPPTMPLAPGNRPAVKAK